MPHAAHSGEQPGVGHIEEVVTRNAKVQSIDALRSQRVVEDPLVVGVSVLLCRPGGEWPAAHRGLRLLHRQVGAFDQAHLDRSATGRPATGGPITECHHRGEGIRQVGLQHNASLELRESRLVEDAREDGDGEIEILVFLHVEVDELGRRRGGCALEQRGEARDDVLDIRFERPRRVRSHGRRDLDRHVVDVIPGKQSVGTGEATGRFPLPKHRFPEEVHVELRALSAERPDRGAEFRRRGIHDEVADHTAQNPTGYWHDDSREERSKHAAEAHRSAQGHGQERGHSRRERCQVASGNPEVLRADDAVDEADREVEPLRILQHSGEAPGGGVHRHP